jgi:hypothetical protein
MAARARFAERKSGQMSARTDILQHRPHCLSRAWSCRQDCCCTEDVHQVDHRHGSIHFGEARGNRCEGARS